MKLIQLYDVLFEAKEDKLAQTFGKKILARVQADPNIPANIRAKINDGGEEMIPLNVVRFLAQYDPTPQRKYLQWMILQYVRGIMLLEDAYKLPETFQKFEQYAKRLPIKNIEQYKSYRDLESAIAEFERAQAATGTAERSTGLKTFLARPDVQSHMGEKHVNIIYQSPRLLVVEPRHQGASCALGKGTKWCVAATQSANYFDHYTRQGPLYFMFTDQGRKYGIHFETGNFMDEQDSPVNILDIIDENPEVLKAFNADQIGMTAARGWKNSQWERDNYPGEAMTGTEMFLELWKRHKYIVGPKGQAKLFLNEPMAVMDLAKQGYPVPPEAHAMAVESVENPWLPDVKPLFEFYKEMAQQGKLPDILRIALTSARGLEEFGTPEEAQQHKEMMQHAMEDRAEHYGTIEQVYQRDGLTPALMERMAEAQMEETGSDIKPLYTTPYNAIIIDEYDSFQQFLAQHKNQIGHEAEYAYNLYQGNEYLELYDAPSNAAEAVFDALPPETVDKEIWQRMTKDTVWDDTYDAFVEYAEDNGLEAPEGEEGHLDYYALLDDVLYPDGKEEGIDKNFVWEILDGYSQYMRSNLSDLKDKVDNALRYAYINSMERAMESEIHNQLTSWLAEGVDANIAGRAIQWVPRKKQEYVDFDSSFVMTMHTDDYVNMISEIEIGNESWPRNDEVSDVDSFSYNTDWAEPEEGAMVENFNEYAYVMDE